MLPAALLDHAAELLRRVLRFDAAADAVVAAYAREQRTLGARDRQRLAELVFRVLRERRLIEHLAAARAAGGSLERRLAQVAASDELAALDHAALPAPLRHNLPDWLADALLAQVGEAEFWPLVAALNAPAPLDLRVNPLRLSRAAALAALRERGIDAAPTPHSPLGLRVAGKPALGRLDLLADGALEVQDEGSQLLASLVGAKRRQTVVDFCAGAGGKTLALGAAMRDSGRLYALDPSAHRLAALKARAERAGLSCVVPMAIAHERDERIGRLAGKVDAVLVDAPCSGLGTLRRNPDLKWRQTPATVAAFAERQRAILAAAALLPRPGGRLVYGTCSLLADENEAIADAFTAAQPQFEPLDAQPLLRAAQVDGADRLTTRGALRLWPHRHGSDGFFAAVWRRR